MLDKYFVPFDRSLKLKEFGFDEECVAFYENNILKAIDQHWGMSFSGISKKSGDRVDDLILAPLFCQVFDWFREKHEYYIHIEEKYSLNTDIQVYQFRHPDNDKLLKFKTFEEAQLACLDKLIEICEESSVS